MKLIIAGTRTATYADTLEGVNLSGLRHKATVIVSGTAAGADRHGEDIALLDETAIKRFPADWRKHKRAAGPIRNREMAEYADALVAIWDGKSKGTLNMIQEAYKRGLKVFIYVYRTETVYPGACALPKEDETIPGKVLQGQLIQVNKGEEPEEPPKPQPVKGLIKVVREEEP